IEDIPLDANGDPILQQVLADTDPPALFIQPLVEIGGSLWTLDSFLDIDVVVGTEYIDAGAVAQDEGDVFGCPPTIVIDNPVTTESATPADEPFEVIYTATDHTGKESTASRFVNVIGTDLTPPVIQLLLSPDPNEVAENGSVFEVDVEIGATWEEPGFYAFDNVDLDLTSSVTIGGETVDLEKVGEYTIVYNVQDAGGNIAAATRIVNVLDRTGPTVGIIGPVPSVVPCNGNYFEFGANAFDEVDGTVDITIGGDPVCTTLAGSYIVTYTATDASGNVSTESRLVIVQGDCDVACIEVGIEDSFLYRAINMRPNPTKGLLHINAEGVDMENATVEVYNVVGKLISTTSMTGNVHTADLSVQPAGIYMVKVNTNEGSIAKKIIVE
ncbi:MAG: immunoglobulin-like domain-containing protein, partial [Chitinophagales bacterium]